MNALDYRLAEPGRSAPAWPGPQPASSGPAGADHALQAAGLCKRYGDALHPVHALLDVDLAVRRGEIVGVLGPNGAGKTTLMSILEGLLAPDAGQVRLLGAPLQDRAAWQRAKARLGVAMQHSVLPPTLSIVELVGTVSRLYPQPRPAAPLVEALGLNDKRHAQVRHLSGGQQQRVAVALALVGDPHLVFLDEPTSQLDPQARRAVWDIVLEQRRRRDAGVLLTTHQMEEAERLCERVLILDHGRVLDHGSPRELVQRHCPQRRISFTTPAGTDLAALGEGVSRGPAAGGEQAVTWRPADLEGGLMQLMALARSAALPVRDLRVDSQTLEDVFIQLTGRRIRT
jgi:ABC-2 type transport system ATP-binding protein